MSEPGVYKVHQHVRFEGGRIRAAQIYPEKLRKAICTGLQKQMEIDRKGQFLTMTMDDTRDVSSKELMNVAKQMSSEYQSVEEDNQEEMEAAWDDVSGAALNPKAVKRARKEEIDYVHKMLLYDKLPVEECISMTGRSPISTRWIDINKGDASNPDYRLRLVAREMKTHKRNGSLAATHPLEALKMILAMTATANKGESIMINDISRAFSHARVKRNVYVQMPKEDQLPGEEHMRGKLKFSMYSTRDAAQNWFQEYSQHLINIGFRQADASPCTFYNRDKGIFTHVHDDDYVSCGTPDALQWMKHRLEKQCQVKTQMLGPDEIEEKQVRIIKSSSGMAG